MLLSGPRALSVPHLDWTVQMANQVDRDSVPCLSNIIPTVTYLLVHTRRYEA